MVCIRPRAECEKFPNRGSSAKLRLVAVLRSRIGGYTDPTFVALGGADHGATTADEAACGAGKSLGNFSSTKGSHAYPALRLDGVLQQRGDSEGGEPAC